MQPEQDLAWGRGPAPAGRAFSCHLPVPQGPAGPGAQPASYSHSTACGAVENVLSVHQRRPDPLPRRQHRGRRLSPPAASATTMAVSQNKGHKGGSPQAPRVAATAFPRPPPSRHHLPWWSLWPLLAPLRPWGVVLAFSSRPPEWNPSWRLHPSLGPVPRPLWAQGHWDGCREGSQVERNRRELVQEEHWSWSPPEWAGWAGLAPQGRVKRGGVPGLSGGRGRPCQAPPGVARP